MILGCTRLLATPGSGTGRLNILQRLWGPYHGVECERDDGNAGGLEFNKSAGSILKPVFKYFK